MGTLIRNIYVGIHRTGAGSVTIAIRGHQGNISKDSEYNIAITERANFVANAQSGATAFDSYMSTATGTWWNQWDSLWREDFRQAAIELG